MSPPCGQDLAARNVLVGEGELCKVADFGLLRELPKDDTVYHSVTNFPCPIRWMSPEAISKRSFSSASDVWSFGVLQWEMFHPGKLPYGKFSNIECATNVSGGGRQGGGGCMGLHSARSSLQTWLLERG